MTTGEPPSNKILAETTVCTVEDRGDGTVDVQMGTVILRLDRRDVASLAGTLRKVVRTLFPKPEGQGPPRARREPPSFLKLVHDATKRDPADPDPVV